MPEPVGVEGFGDRVREARLRLRHKDGRRWTQQDLAEAVGVRGNTVSEWERGRQPKDLGTVARAAEVLGVTLDWLLHGEGEGLVRVAISDDHGPAKRAERPRVQSQRMRVAMHQLLAELSPQGLSEEDEDFVRSSFAMAETSLRHHGGFPHEPTDRELEVEANAVTEAMRVWFRERRKRRAENHG